MDQPNPHVAQFRQRLKALPVRPGVYLFRDRAGRILYVGKAGRLRHRVRSYFGKQGDLSLKSRNLVAIAADFEFIVTDTEKEALVLECILIKQHRPRFNVTLRDDKQYLYLKIGLTETYPRISLVRQPARDGARYFGPFTNARPLRATLAHLQRLFQFRTCTLDMAKVWPRPCLLYHINRCLGPCIRASSEQEYRQAIQSLIAFMEGKSDAVIGQLRQDMAAAAAELAYERAGAIRDRLRAAEKMGEPQKITRAGRGDVDVIAAAVDGPDACVQVFTIRNDKVVGRENFPLQHADDTPIEEILTQFVQQYYERATFVPPCIVLQADVQSKTALAEWLDERRGGAVRLEVPRRGEKRKLVALVAENAREALEQAKVQWLSDERKTRGAVLELQHYLQLPYPPHRIECYDISNIQGTSPVASMVVFEHGQPRRDCYRRFHIKTVHQADDFSMMAEVIRRRFKRAADSGAKATAASRGEVEAVVGELAAAFADTSAAGDGEFDDPWLAADLAQQEYQLPAPSPQGPADGWSLLPDLVIVDGGKGQLSAALEAMAEVGATGVVIVGLAKEREELFLPRRSTPLLLPRNSEALYLVQRVRDEAHRFAITFHRQVRSRRTFRSRLDEVPGVGPKRKKALLSHFGSVQRIREATREDLAAVPGMTLAAATTLKEYL